MGVGRAEVSAHTQSPRAGPVNGSVYVPNTSSCSWLGCLITFGRPSPTFSFLMGSCARLPDIGDSPAINQGDSPGPALVKRRPSWGCWGQELTPDTFRGLRNVLS